MNAGIYRKLIKFVQEDTVVKFYKSKEWRKMRAFVMQRDNNECQTCKRAGRCSKGQMVHHLEEVKKSPIRALDSNNLETECNACHNRVHDKLPNQKKRFTNTERW